MKKRKGSKEGNWYDVALSKDQRKIMKNWRSFYAFHPIEEKMEVRVELRFLDEETERCLKSWGFSQETGRTFVKRVKTGEAYRT